jgi:hypothetical protein
VRAKLYLEGKLRACVCALALAVLVLTAMAAPASALPAKFWGVVPQANPTEEQFQRLHRGGVDSIRLSFNWASLQPTPDAVINWAEVDSVVERATKNGIEVLPFLSAAPAWAVPLATVPGTGGGAKAPGHLPAAGASAAAWSTFVRQAVERYGPNGSFWATHPALPVRPIRAWQVWNEPNFKYFVAHPNPVEYGKLVKLSFTTIRGVDPGAQIVLGGMFAKPKGGRFLRPGKKKLVANPTSPNFYASYFLEQMYKGNPGIKSKFNGVALHPYTPSYTYLAGEIEEFRKILTLNHDSAKGLWITELGWSSQPPNPAVNQFAKGMAGQAQQLRGSFSLLERKQAKWRLQRVYWFSVDDQPGSCNFCDGSGLFGSGFKPKKAWFEYVKFAGGTP